MKTDRRKTDAGFIARHVPGSCLRPSAFCLLPSAFEDGGALVMVMIIICVLSVVAASLLLTTTSRYYTTFQSATWQESIVASESGVDLAMNELRKRVIYGSSSAFGTNWTTVSPGGTAYSNYGHAFPTGSTPYTLTTPVAGVESNTATQVRVYVDVPGASDSPGDNFAIPPTSTGATFISEPDNPNLADSDGVDRSRWWYRIRALGVAGVSGPARPNLEKLDNRLRRFSFFTDWRTGQPVSSPQVARMVEVVAKPLTNFRNALMADTQINLSNQDVLIDSYDSSQGPYSSATNHGQMGNIATNGQLINANNATVDGSAMTNNGTVQGGGNVIGQQSSTFYQELTPLTPATLNPAWSNVPDGGTVTTDTTYTASADAAKPTLVRLDGINLPIGGHIISIAAATTASGANGQVTTTSVPSYIKIYVNGDINTAVASFINIDPNVSTIFYVSGNVYLQGVGIINNSYLASHLVINGLQPPANTDGTYPARSISIYSTEDFEGIVYAPNHDLILSISAPLPTSGTAQGSSSNLTDIANVQSQITSITQDLQGNQIAYGQDSAKPGVGNANKAAQDLAQIAADQAKLNALNQELAIYQGTSGPASSAADHAQGYGGIYGGFVANTITVAHKTHVHYDETLRQAGTVNHYEIVSWFEDNISRDATGGAEEFWWQK